MEHSQCAIHFNLFFYLILKTDKWLLILSTLAKSKTEEIP